MNDLKRLQLQNFVSSSNTVEWNFKWLDLATNFSQKFSNSNRKFNLYLQILALFSFESWLSSREPNLKVNIANASTFKPELANILDVVCNVIVGEFKICLIPTLNASDSEIAIPRYAVEVSQFIPHFYVLIEIDEESNISFIKSFIDYNRLVTYKDSYALDLDWNYAIPSNLWDCESAKLLTNCQCLSDEAIAIPKTTNNYNLANSKQQLQQILPTVKEQPLWKKLTWLQAVIVLTTPDLRSWLYRSLTNSNEQFSLYLKDLLTLLIQPAMDLRSWLQSRLNSFNAELTWQMLPNNLEMSAMRKIDRDNPIISLDYILQQIQAQTEIKLPSIVGKAYQQFDLETPLRLYGVTWLISDRKQTWGLLLIVGSLSSNLPPYGIELRVSDYSSIIQEQELTSDSGTAYLCTYLEANAKDKLLVTIVPADGSSEISRIFEFSF